MLCVDVAHIKREANKCADWLANWSLTHDLGLHNWATIFHSPKDLLVADAMGSLVSFLSFFFLGSEISLFSLVKL